MAKKTNPPRALRAAAKPRLQSSASTDDESLPPLTLRPQRKLRRMDALGRFYLGIADPGTHSKIPYMARRKFAELEFERDSQLDDERKDFYEREKVGIGRNRGKINARFVTTKWLGGINDTAFAKTDGSSRQKKTTDGEKSVLLRKFDDSIVARLADEVDGDEAYIKPRKKARLGEDGAISVRKYVPLQMVTKEELEEAVDWGQNIEKFVNFLLSN